MCTGGRFIRSKEHQGILWYEKEWRHGNEGVSGCVTAKGERHETGEFRVGVEQVDEDMGQEKNRELTTWKS